MIPKIIHQLWIGPKLPPLDLMNSWRQLNPDYEYIFWNESMLHKNFPNGLHNQKQYDEMRELCGRCDIARFEILFKFGGFFIDADSICISPLDDFLLNNDSFSCYESEIQRPGLVAIGYLGATKNNHLMEIAIEGINKLDIGKIVSRPEANPAEPQHMAWQIVGSLYLTKTIQQFRYNSISIYPSHFFIPEHYTGLKYVGPVKPYARQLWGSTISSPFFGYNTSKMNPQWSQT